MDSVAALSGEAHAELRAVISGLAPPDLGERGLAESLRRYAALAGRAHGVTGPVHARRTSRRWAAAATPPPTGSPRRPCTTRCGTPAPAR